MSWSTYFVQECPTCGRRLQVQVHDLGREMSCAHCSARFIATDQPFEQCRPADPITDLLNRAENYLEETSSVPRKPR